MSTKLKIQKRGQDFQLAQKENYVPFSNLSLCPKTIIALVQSSFDTDELESTLNGLKITSQKHISHLQRMRSIADKQEQFIFQGHSLIDTLTHDSEQSYFIKDSPIPYYEDSYPKYYQ